jgi:chaperonin GroES
MEIKPVRHVAMIKPDKVEQTSSGGLFLPETTRTRMQISVDRGKIVAIGEGFFEDMPGPVPKVGDKVIFDKYAGSLITIEESREDFRLVNDDKIIAIIAN